MLVEMLKENEIELNESELSNYNKINEKLLENGFQVDFYYKNACSCNYRLDGLFIYPVNTMNDTLNLDGSIGNSGSFCPELKASELDDDNDVNNFLDRLDLAIERFRAFEKLKELGYVNKKVKAVVIEKHVKDIEIELNERNLLRIIERHANLKDLINIENNETEIFENIIPTLDFKEIYFKGMFKINKEKTEIFSFLKEPIK